MKKMSKITIQVLDKNTRKRIPARVMIKPLGNIKAFSEKQRFYDGGKFYCNGKFWIKCRTSRIEMYISHGYEYVPSRLSLRIVEGKNISLNVQLKKWIDLKSIGLYSSDFGVNFDVPRSFPKKDADKFISLVCRAEDLDFCINDKQAGLYPFVNTSANDLMDTVELYFNAVKGFYAGGFNVFRYNPQAEQLIYFFLLNSGDKIALSACSESSIFEKYGLPPGMNRLYTKIDNKPEVEELLKNFNSGRNFATNGYLFPFLKINNRSEGESIVPEPGMEYVAEMEIYAINKISKIELLRNGNPVKIIKPLVKHRGSKINVKYKFSERQSCWYLLRVFDEKGACAVTNPIYFLNPLKQRKISFCIFVCLGNFLSNYIAGKDFYFHIMCLTGEENIKNMFLFKDGIPVCEFSVGKDKNFFETSHRIECTGYYHIQMQTSSSTLLSQPLLYDSSSLFAHEISYLLAGSVDNKLEVREWREDDTMLSQIKKNVKKELNFSKDKAWEINVNLEGIKYEFKEGTDLSGYFY